MFSFSVPSPVPAVQQPEALNANDFVLTRDVGNVTEDSEVTFEFSVRSAAALQKFAVDNKVSFQLQMTYTKLDGMKWYVISFNRIFFVQSNCF